MVKARKSSFLHRSRNYRLRDKFSEENIVTAFGKKYLAYLLSQVRMPLKKGIRKRFFGCAIRKYVAVIG